MTYGSGAIKWRTYRLTDRPHQTCARYSQTTVLKSIRHVGGGAKHDGANHIRRDSEELRKSIGCRVKSMRRCNKNGHHEVYILYPNVLMMVGRKAEILASAQLRPK